MFYIWSHKGFFWQILYSLQLNHHILSANLLASFPPASAPDKCYFLLILASFCFCLLWKRIKMSVSLCIWCCTCAKGILRGHEKKFISCMLFDVARSVSQCVCVCAYIMLTDSLCACGFVLGSRLVFNNLWKIIILLKGSEDQCKTQHASLRSQPSTWRRSKAKHFSQQTWAIKNEPV